jgi:hypothetical protein
LEFLEWSYCDRQFCELTLTLLTAPYGLVWLKA